MKKSRLLGAVCACLVTLSFNANAATIVDQSFSGTGLAAAINQCCSYIAQTFTAGETADLTAVSADITHNDSLTLAIYNTDQNGTPGTTALSSLTVFGNGLIDLSDVFSFSSPLSIIKGETYALVASIANGAGGSWEGAGSNGYSGGSVWGASITDDWFLHYSSDDLNFATYIDSDSIVVPPPSSPVPVPAAVWLFSSGLLGLIGVARRKNAA